MCCRALCDVFDVLFMICCLLVVVSGLLSLFVGSCCLVVVDCSLLLFVVCCLLMVLSFVVFCCALCFVGWCL